MTDSIPMIATVRTLSFDAQGDGLREEHRFPARYREEGGHCTLTYVAEEDGTCTETTLSFEKGDPCVLNLLEKGARRCSLSFDTRRASVGCYEVPGLATFPIAISVRTLSNDLSCEGGRLLLDYRRDLGGQSGRIRLTVALERMPGGSPGEKEEDRHADQ